MSFPEIKRAEPAYYHGPYHFDKMLKEEHLSRAKWARAIAKSINVKEVGFELSKGEKKAIKELLRVAEADEEGYVETNEEEV